MQAKAELWARIATKNVQGFNGSTHAANLHSPEQRGSGLTCADISS